MKYRAEIDGLRALAVIPVILFHAGFEIFRGGFIGVDVFFIISGYLIRFSLIFSGQLWAKSFAQTVSLLILQIITVVIKKTIYEKNANSLCW